MRSLNLLPRTFARGGPRAVRAARLLRACVALLVAAAGIAAPRSGHADIRADEYRVKAAFLYKFGGFVEWPDGAYVRADSPVAIGVMGADALADELVQIVGGRNVNGRPVSVRRLRAGDSIVGLHVLFVGRADGGRLAEILAEAKGHPLLTVTESDQALELGSVINFVVIEDKVRFDVALAPADLGSLKISARLLAVARKVVSRSS
jgi:hypothetical protein